jgi:hypothetical protein
MHLPTPTALLSADHPTACQASMACHWLVSLCTGVIFFCGLKTFHNDKMSHLALVSALLHHDVFRQVCVAMDMLDVSFLIRL